jgi:hypothetical protein
MPTSFSGENIIYKYMDQNMFALATVNKQNDLTIYLINSISGKVIHRFFEKKVRLELPIDMVLCENTFIISFQRQTTTGIS